MLPEELRAAEQRVHREATERAALLHQQTGPCAQRRHIQTRAWAVEADYPHARQAAQRRDREAAELAQRRAVRLVEQEQQHAQRLAPSMPSSISAGTRARSKTPSGPPLSNQPTPAPALLQGSGP